MNWYDILMVVIIVAGFLYGMIKGIVSEIFALIGIVGGFVVAMKFSFILKPYILPFVKKEIVAVVFSFAVLLILTAVIFIMLGVFFRKALKIVHLSWLDRFVGGIFGIVKGLVIAGLISLLIFVFLPGGKTFIGKSTIGKYTVNVVRLAIWLLPEKVRKKLKTK
ncbi:MAG: hypothetical protein B5M53_05065 [Candidatus Cloacimonas sp. 4484_209]|nr:MAG: hypothetical protein B5M53_05065 [Candidatus Cloacimonas sp. 4484_209]